MPKILGKRGNKLLVDAQRAANGPFGQQLGRLFPNNEEDNKDATIRRLQAEMVESRHILVTINFKMLAPKTGEGSLKVRSVCQEFLPWDGSKGKQAHSYYTKVESQSDTKFESNKRKVPLS